MTKRISNPKITKKLVKAHSEKDTQTIKDHSTSTSLVRTALNQRDVLDYSNGLGNYIVCKIYIYIYIYKLNGK